MKIENNEFDSEKVINGISIINEKIMKVFQIHQ